MTKTKLPLFLQLVAVKDGNKIKRAQVVEIEPAAKQDKYTCWLVDYGAVFHADLVYELDSTHKILSPIALRASLIDVVYLETVRRFHSVVVV